MWLDWLRDEMKMALTEEEKCKIPVLFERAAQDYLSMKHNNIFYITL